MNGENFGFASAFSLNGSGIASLFNYAENESNFNSTSNPYTTNLTLNFNVLVAAFYFIDYCFEITVASSGGPGPATVAEGRCQLNATTIGEIQTGVLNSTNDYSAEAGFKRAFLAAGPHTVTIDLARRQGSGSVRQRRARIRIFRVN